MAPARRWTVRDRQGNEVYLTDERWEHIVEGHPEMHPHEAELRDTVRSGRRTQEPLAPQKFRYSKRFTGLLERNTHLVAIVLFRYIEGEGGRPVPNNYVVTAYRSRWDDSMPEPRIRYDEASDTLYIAFAPGEHATGLELNDHLLLRVDQEKRAAVGLTLFNYSLLAQPTEMGPRSFALTGIAELPRELRELALAVLRNEPRARLSRPLGLYTHRGPGGGGADRRAAGGRNHTPRRLIGGERCPSSSRIAGTAASRRPAA